MSTSLAMLLLADARLPVGGHTQSAGLEPAALSGMPVASVPAYVEARLRTSTLVDAGSAVVALRSLRAGGGGAGGLWAAYGHWAARTPSQHQRAAADLAGRGYLRVLDRLAPGSAYAGSVRQLPSAARPFAMAALGAHLGLDARMLATAMVHDDVATITSAALKVYPLDPLEATEWTVAAGSVGAEIVDAVADLVDPRQIPCPSAPLVEAWVDDHSRSNRRLFRA